MANCKLCKTKIPDNAEYCDDCLDKANAKANESYLDSLLSSVKNTAPTNETMYKKKSETNFERSNKDIHNGSDQDIFVRSNNVIDNNSNKDIDIDKETNDEDIFKFDLEDIEDFDQFDLDEDLDELKDEEFITDQDLFGDDINQLLYGEEANKPIQPQKSEPELAFKEPEHDLETQLQVQTSEFKPEQLGVEPENINSYYQESENSLNNDIVDNDNSLNKNRNSLNNDIINNVNSLNNNVDNNMVSLNNDIDNNFVSLNNDIGNNSLNNDIDNNIASLTNDLDDNINENEIYKFEPDDNNDLNELLNQLDEAQNIKNNLKSEQVDELITTDVVPEEIQPQEDEKVADYNEEEYDDQEDFLSLLSQISDDDPVANDVKAISDLMSGLPAEPIDGSGVPNDVGAVFSDALKTVTSLNDPNLNEEEILGQIPENKGKKSKKKKKDKKNKNKTEAEGEALEQKPKVSLLTRLFGNVEDKNAKKKASVINDSFHGEMPLESEGKKDKKKKGKKGKNSQGDESEGKGKSSKDSELDGTEEKKGKKTKKTKKEKKPKSNEIIQALDEIDEDEGRINRLGASIVFVFFGLLALLIVVGSNAVTYTLSIQNATNYFNKQKYTQAYYEVYGLDQSEIKDEDVEIYSKIMTVMFVNKQLNSYNNYCALKEYPQALDSLLKGLKRYDKYIELATMLGIKTDMDYVRNQIIAELKKEFNLSEQDALNIINSDNMKAYSMKVFDVALQNE